MRHAGVRVLAIVVAAFTCLAQLSSLGHFLLLEHAVCPEHGEWIHAGEQEHHGVRASDEIRENSAFRAAPATAGADEHEHCIALCERRERFVLRPEIATIALAPQAEELAGDWLDGRDRKPAIAVFLIAPKNSPPS